MSPTEHWTVLLHLAATLTMVGVIWFVQIVHYPLFARVGLDGFRRYEMDHQRLTAWVVGPPMLVELITASLLVWWQPVGLSLTMSWIGLALVLSIWAVTYSVQVPQHASLILRYDGAVQRRLVLGNWYRTFAWTTRGLLVLWMVGQLLTTTANSPAAEMARNSLP